MSQPGGLKKRSHRPPTMCLMVSDPIKKNQSRSLTLPARFRYRLGCRFVANSKGGRVAAPNTEDLQY